MVKSPVSVATVLLLSICHWAVSQFVFAVGLQADHPKYRHASVCVQVCLMLTYSNADALVPPCDMCS